MKASLGFWAAVVLVVVRALNIAPALAAQGPGAVSRAAFAAGMFVIYVAGTLMTVRRMTTAGPQAATGLVWIQGMTGLILGAVFLWLV